MIMKPKKHQEHRNLVLYMYCYPPDLFCVAPMYGRLAVKFGMATLDEDTTALESARARMNHQKGKDSNGSTNEAYGKIVLASWDFSKLTKYVQNDHVIAGLLKSLGYRDTSVLDGSGTEWYMLPFNSKSTIPDAIKIVEALFQEHAGGQIPGLVSAIPKIGEYRIEYDESLLTLSEARELFEDKMYSSGLISSAYTSFLKTDSLGLRSVFMGALNKSTLHPSKFQYTIARFVESTFYAGDSALDMVSPKLYAPALLPCHETSAEFLAKVPPDTDLVEVVNDPITFISLVVLGSCKKVRYVGPEEHVAAMTKFSKDEMIELVGIDSASKDAYFNGLKNHFTTSNAQIRILNAPLCVGEADFAGVKLIDSARGSSDVLIAGVAADTIMNRRDSLRPTLLNGLSELRLVNDPAHNPSLLERFISKSVNVKEHFEAVGILVYKVGHGGPAMFSDGRKALVYGPRDEHSLPFIGCESTEFDTPNDLSHVGLIKGLGEFIDAGMKAHHGSFVGNAPSLKAVKDGEVVVLYPGRVGNPVFKKGTVPAGAEIVFADGRRALIEKRFFLATRPSKTSTKYGATLPMIAESNDGAIEDACKASMLKRHAEAYLKFQASDQTLIALGAALALKQTTIGNVLGNQIPFKNVPWADIELGKFDEYVATVSGLSIEVIRRVTNTIIDRITYSIE